MNRLFTDRADAGRALAQRLHTFTRARNATVVALPRGGVPVGYEVARALDLPLGILLVRKVGVPAHEEMAMGAVSDDGTYVVNQAVIDELRIPQSDFFAVLDGELTEAKRRRELYCGNRGQPHVSGKTVIVVDDGLATGSTMRLALCVLRRQGAAKLVLAVPLAPIESRGEFAGIADEFVCIHTPFPFVAVGAHYAHFEQNSDAEVCALLALGTHTPSREEGSMNDDTVNDLPDEDDADSEVEDTDEDDDETDDGSEGTTSRSDSGAGE